MEENKKVEAEVVNEAMKTKEEKPKFKDKVKNWWKNGGKETTIATAITAGTGVVLYFAGKTFLKYCDDQYRLDLNRLLKNPMPDNDIKALPDTETLGNMIKDERNLNEFTEFIQSSFGAIIDKSKEYRIDDFGVMFYGGDSPETVDICYIVDGMEI